MKNIALAVGVFVVLLISLSFGERISTELLHWLSYLTGLAFNNLQDVIHAIQQYLNLNWGKVVLALILTLPISYWLSRKHQSGDNSVSRRLSKRKTAIFLAFFLGWAGIHRFYIGQLGWGLIYLVLFYLFAPLSVILGWIDALRYALMSDDEFMLRL